MRSRIPITVCVGILVSAGLTFGCGVPKEQYQRQVTLADQLHKQLKECESQKGDMGPKVAELEKELATVRQSLEDANQKLATAKAAQDELERIRKKMAAEKALNDKLNAAFKDMISAGQLKVVNVDGRLVIQMAARILFRAGRADLTTKGNKALARIGKILAKVDRHFQVAGHTDNRPIKRSKKYNDNWELAAQRAVNVVKLLRKVGVPGKNLSAASFSAFQPSHTNRTRIGRRLNRRIEITLLPVIPDKVKRANRS